MKNKFLVIFLGLFLVVIVILIKVDDSNPPYNCLIWNNTNYAITYEPVSDKDIGECLGDVKKQVSVETMPKNHAESNYLKAGTKIFTLQKENDLNALVVKTKENNADVYYKAYKVVNYNKTR